MFHAGPRPGKTLLRPSIELAFACGRLRYGIRPADASPENSVASIHTPTLLVHGMADTSIPVQQSEMILARSPAAVTLWKVPGAEHCAARYVAGREFDQRVLDWFSSNAR
jgi:pimeloyl-ACP methyl ester carboxylesterase